MRVNLSNALMKMIVRSEVPDALILYCSVIHGVDGT
jgi:hypothetical protein